MSDYNRSQNSNRNSSSLLDLIKDNPLPSALIGLGVGLLAAGSATAAGSAVGSDESGGDSSTKYISGYSEPVSYDKSPDYIGAKSLPRPGQTSASQHSSRGQQSNSQSRSSSNNLSRWVEDYPLAVGAVTALIGAAIGLSMPGSRIEDELMGDTSDTLIHEAKSTVGDVVDVAKETANQAVSTATEEFQNRTGSPEDLRSSVKSSVKSAANNVTSEVKDAAKNVVEETKKTAKAEAEKRNLKSESN